MRSATSTSRSWSRRREIAAVHRRYAQALFDAAKEQGRLREVYGELSDFAAAVRDVPELRNVLRNPELDPATKADLLDALIGGADQLVRNFLRLTTVPNVPPAAATSDQWASRVVDWFLRPLSPDLLVIGNFANSQVRFYIETQNQQALQTIYARMNDLQRCDDHLTRVGPPPGNDQ